MQTKKQSLRDRLRKRSKLGFSLVELIVVIAIMAVLVAVLAPTLLSYVEHSRAQKDESAMGEVTNAVLLAMSDADVYDELLVHSIEDNVSCYIDNADEGEVKDYITVTKAATKKVATQYTFGDNARLADEKPYYAAGNMRGVTITFKPNGSTNTSTYVLAEGVINKFDEDAEGVVVLEDCQHLYNAVRATVGNEIKHTSQTYRNSEYTIFIKIGSLGGAQAEAQDAVQVYGQYNGTNLALSEEEVGRATAATVKDDGTIEQTPSGPVVDEEDTGENLNHSGTIPEGGVYKQLVNPQMSFPRNGIIITWDGINQIEAGQPFPEEPYPGDVYCYGDYEYYFCINTLGDSWVTDDGPGSLIGGDKYLPLTGGWSVLYKSTSSEPGVILDSICDMPIASLSYTFANHTNLTTAPKIPSGVYDMVGTFYGCTLLETAPNIPAGVSRMEETFENCTSLTKAPAIPDGVIKLCRTFRGCTSLTTAPIIPSSIIHLNATFSGCTSLTGKIEINTNPYDAPNMSEAEPIGFFDCFEDVDFQAQKITLIGSSTMLDKLGATGSNYCAECNGCCNTEDGSATFTDGTTLNWEQLMDQFPGVSTHSIAAETFIDCDTLKSITIPSSVKTIGDMALGGCIALENVTIQNGVTTIGNGAFIACMSLKNIVLPDSVTNLGQCSFGQCLALEEITLSSNLTIINEATFSSCEALKDIVIPDGVKTLGNCAFDICPTLESVTIPSSVEKMEAYAFRGCPELKDIIFKGTAEQWNTLVNNSPEWYEFCGDFTVTCTG